MPTIRIDPLQKPAELILGKKTYQLGFDFDAIAKAEAATGMSLMFGIDWSNIGVERLAGILKAAIGMYQPDITDAEIRSIIRPRNVKRIESALVAAWFTAMPEADEQQEEEQAPNPQ